MKTKSINIKTKFLITSIIIMMLFIVVGIYSVFQLSSVNNRFKTQVSNNNPIITDVINSIEDINNIRTEAFLIAFDIGNGKVDYDDFRARFSKAHQESVETLEAYIKSIEDFTSINSADRADLLDFCKKSLELVNSYFLEYNKYLDLMEQNKQAEALEQDVKVVNIGNELFSSIYELPSLAFSDMVVDLDDTSKHTGTVITFSIVLIVIIILLVQITLIRLSSSIIKPINKIKNGAEEVLKGKLDIDLRTNNTDELSILSNTIANMCGTIECIIDDINSLSEHLEKGETSYRINTEKYNGAFKDATEAINIATNGLVQDSIYVSENIKYIALGDFEHSIKQLPGDKAIATDALANLQLNLKEVSNQIDGLINAAINGNLDYKIDSEKYSGQWKASMDGLNTFVNGVVVPIKETQNALNHFAKGNFNHRITNEYKGEFNNIKQTVNYTAETIGSYISEISNILNEMANKNFDVSIDRDYLGDFKAIQQSVNLIVDNLNILTRDIISSAEQVSAGSKQISESSISLAEGATQQAESVEKLNHITKSIASQTKENTQNSNKANTLALETRENASKGSEQMDSMLVAMEEINTASSSISNIIKVIDDIAFQTNILALNAAVEAARAGEHGKGFAVVAEEVRSLAARSQQAARETTELIESSVEKVGEGSKIANQTSEALISIVKQIEEISALVDTCAKSSNEQEKAILQITEAISQISSVTQNNTATSEESAAASQELASQAEVFYASVADFKLKNDNRKQDIKVSNMRNVEKPKMVSKTVAKPNLNKNISNIDLSSDDMIILNDDTDIIINESLDFGKY